MIRRLALLLVLGLVLAGCAGGDDDGTDQADGGGDAGATDQATPPSGDFDAGVDTIKIGMIQPFSGPIGFLGQFLQNSVQVEVDRINAAGGLGGAQLEIVTRDNELNPQLAVQAAQEFSGDDEIAMVVGPSFTGFFNAAKQIFEDNQMINCQSAVAGADALEGLRYSFRTQDPDQFRTVALFDYLEANSDVQSVALVYENDDTGKGYDALLPELTEERGMEYVGFQATRPDDQTHRAQMEAVKDADAVLISNNSTFAAKSAAAANEIGYEGQLIGFSGLQGFTYVEGAPEGADGTIFASNYLGYFTRDEPEQWPDAYREHVQTVIEEYGETEGPKSGIKQYNGSALPADCVVLFERAVQQAQSLEPDAIVDAWESLDIPREEMPSFVRAQFGPDDHEEYAADDLYIYEWTQEDGEWFLEPLAGPDVG